MAKSMGFPVYHPEELRRFHFGPRLAFLLLASLLLGLSPAIAAPCNPCTIWKNSVVPGTPSANDGQPIETGVKFQTDTAGVITGIRFYKGTGNTGAHTGHLWTSAGVLLATASFIGETASGWQQAPFSPPIPISPNTTYIASYFSAGGGYAFDGNYFVSEFANAPLHALADGVDGPNGVYYYGSSGFPTSSFQKSNYWVDVILAIPTVPDATAPTVTSVSPAPGAGAVGAQSSVIAIFNEALDPATVASATFELSDSLGALVPATVRYDAFMQAATLLPSSPLAYPAAYTATLKGGPTGIKDLAGNPLAADYAWSFTTVANTNLVPAGWYSGDVHVHRSCGGSPVPVSTIHDAMVAQDINVISLLADMGNGEVQDPVTDLPKVTGQDDPISTPGRIVHWDTEWHWDATYTQYPHQALGGHLLNLGLTEAHTIWDESTFPIEQWARQQGGISGFAHMQYLNDSIPTSLTCCTPVEYPVEVALGGTDFIEEDVNGSDAATNAYSRLLNCGFRPGLAAGTDYPCGQVIGPMVTFAQVAGGQLTYRNWVDAIARGRTVVSRVGSGQFAALQVNGTATPGDEIQLAGAGDVSVSVQWTANQSVSGTIELVQNGAVVASQPATAAPGAPGSLTATAHFAQSGWLSARVMNDGVSGHALQTAAVFVTIAGAPVRASAADAQFYVDWMDALITNTSPGGVWNSYFPTELAAAQSRYQAAKTIYQQIAAGGDVAPTVVSHLPATGAAEVPVGSSVSATFNEALDAATVNGSTFLLEDAAHAAVAASVSYDAGLRTATLTPSGPLASSTTYTATLKGGSTDPRIKSTAGTAMAADVSWSFTTQSPDVTPPTVISTLPAAGAAGVSVSAIVNASFSEALDPASVTGSTFSISSGLSGLVTATVSYDAVNRRATLQPTSSLQFSTSYTVTLKGGASGIKDLAGNALAGDVSWTFTTTAAPPPPPNDGPGGPILVISAASNPFSRYPVEILRAEGLNEFTAMDISLVTAAVLADYDVVILGEIPLTAYQVTMLTGWTNAGGTLVAFRPDKQLAGLLGLTDAGATLSNKYLLVNAASGPGIGIINQTIQFHGTADLYTLNGATAVATLYSDASTATVNPAVTRYDVGSNGGQAIAFTYDLARSVVYTRQGNPAWSGQKRDGQIEPIRSDDLFFGNASFDPQPDWVDLNKVTIPQADEQQRLLVNAILLGNLHRKPLPRFWYLPKGLKAAIVMTGDDHGDGGMACRFDIYRNQSAPGCSVDDWECVRATGYEYTGPGFTDSQAVFYNGLGFEVALHVDTGCARATPTQYDGFVTDQLASFQAAFPDIPQPTTNRNHCIAWSDWSSVPEVETAHGIRLDTNYYYWPSSWILNRSGMFTGSGIPMRFAKQDGTIIDSYQASTEMPDESGESFPSFCDQLLDRANGPEGYYGVFTTNMHFDSCPHAGSDAVVASAQARGVPVVSAKQMLTWLDGRNGSSFGNLTWSGNQLSFSIATAAGSRNLRAMVPMTSSVGQLTGITLSGSAVAYTQQTIKGIQYAFFPATSGNYVAQYLVDTTPPVISSVVATPGSGGTATVTWTTDEPATSRVDYGTSPDALGSNVSDSTLVTGHTINLTGLAVNTTYYFRVASTDAANNSATSPNPPAPPASFTMPSAAFIDTTVADFSAGAPDANTAISQIADGEVMLQGAVSEEFLGSTLPVAWTSNTWNSGGAATVVGGQLTVDGAFAGTTATYGSGRSLEFVATLGGGVNQHVGFGVDLNNDPNWAIFSIKTDGTFNARTSGPSTTETPLSSSLLGSPHRYRIEWTDSSVAFFVDGAPVATHSVSFGTTQMRPVASDLNTGGGSVIVDWIRMSPFATSGNFDSRIFDAGQTANWGTLAWTNVLPVGTAVALSVRTGDTAAPDGSWTAFQPMSNGGPIGGASRYLQYRAALSTSDSLATPQLQDVTIGFNVASDTTPPASVLTFPANGSSYNSAGWTGSITGTASDNPGGSGVAGVGVSIKNGTSNFYWNGSSFSSASEVFNSATGTTSWSYAFPSSNLAEGVSYTVRSRATDAVSNVETATPSAMFIFAKVTPTITWANPADIIYPTALGATQLNATASVPGTLVYTPASGTVLSVGDDQTLSVSFTPTDTTNYATAAKSVTINVKPPSFTDTTVADFSAGTAGANTAVSQIANGEVILAPGVDAEFDGMALLAGWSSTPWGTGGASSVSGGLLTVDGARANTDASFSSGISIEFVATFGAATFQNAGLGQTLATQTGESWAMFGTAGTTDTLFARINNNGTVTDTAIPGSWIGSSHRYRIEWNASSVVFLIDGTSVQTSSVSIGATMRPVVSDFAVGGPALTVDWLRLSPFAASGNFDSRLFDAGQSVAWETLTWTQTLPAGTGIALSVRLGNTSTPDGSWSSFFPIANGASIGANSRYIQYHATLTTSDTLSTPVLESVSLGYSIQSETTSPTIVERSPAAGATGVSVTADVTVTFSELMNASTLDSSTFRLRANGAGSDVTASVSYAGTVATLHPNSNLAASTTYQVTVAGTVTDFSGNPLGADATWSFTTAAAVVTFTDTTVSDFSAGTLDANTAVSQIADGEVILAPASGTEFSGTTLPTGWQSAAWSGGTTPTVGDGLLTLNGGHAATTATFGPGRSLEFVATFRAETNQHIGFTADFSFNSPWAIFSTFTSTTSLYARVNSPGGSTDTLISSSLLGSPHRYRIDWNATSFAFYVDGTLVSTITRTISTNMLVHASDLPAGPLTLGLDWLRLTPYASSGTFLSRVFDAGQNANWGMLSWTNLLPAGTAVALSVRTGDTPTPDGSWTTFQAMDNGSAIGASSRYLQYQAVLSTTDVSQTPQLQSVTIGYSVAADTTPPTSVIAFPVNGSSYNAAGWTGSIAGTASDNSGGSGVGSVGVSLKNNASNLYWSGSSFASATEVFNAASGTTSWSYAFSSSNLTNGTSYTVRSRATDAGSNVETAPPSATFTYDTQAPDTVIDTMPPALTGSGSASFTFHSSEASSTFECKLDSGAFALCTSPASLSGLAEGSHTFQVAAADAAGNTDATPASFTWAVDTTPPPAPSITTHPANQSNQPSASFSFTDAEGGVSFGCSLDGGAGTACTSPTNYAGPLTEGSHTFAVVAMDAVGNTSSATSFSWTVDTTAPDTVIDTGPTSPTSGTSASFTFHSTEAGSTFRCVLDGGAPAFCTSPASYSSLAEGSHTFQVAAADAAGNSDASAASFSWTIDTTTPDTILDSMPANPTNQTTATFAFHATEPSSTVECQLDTGEFSACTSPATYSGLSESTHTFDVRAKDQAGNVDATPATFTWTVDTTAPDTMIDTTPPQFTNSNTATFAFHGSEGGTFTCQLDGGGFSSCSSPKMYSGLAEGPHTFQVKETDPAGNMDPTPAGFSWLIDATAPTSAITFPADSASYNTAAWTGSITGTASDNTGGSGLASVGVSIKRNSDNQYWNGSAFASAVEVFNAATGVGSWSYALAGSNLTDGVFYTVRSRAADNASNLETAPAGVTFTFAKVTPTVIWANPSDITYPTALGATQLNATASVPGTFVYTPASGTVLNAGNAQSLKVDFTPTDATNYTIASKTVSINVLKASSTTTFGAAPTPIYLGGNFTVSASNNSAGAITYSQFSGPCTVVNASTGIFSSSGAGLCVVKADSAATTNYLASSATQSVSIGKATPAVTFGPAPTPTYLGGNFTVSASTTNTDTAALTYSAVSGPCASVSGATFSSSGAGTCVVRASGAETTNFLAASNTQSVTIAKATPAVTFGPAPAPTYLGGNFTVSASTTNTDSGMLTYSAVSGPCALVSGATFSSSGAGTCVVRASGAETANFLAASNTQSVTIAKATPSVAFGTAPAPMYLAGNFTVSASTTNTDSGMLTYSAVSGPCALVSGATFSSSGAGTCVVRASGAETANFLAASNTQSVTIAKADSKTTFGPAPTPIYLAGNFTVSASNNSAGVITYSQVSGPCAVVNASTGIFSSSGAGACVVQADTAATTNYLASSATQSVTIGKATPTITWSNPANIYVGMALGATQLNATASTGGAFAYTPPSGTLLPVGPGQTLSVAFTPTDTTNYISASKSVTINVLPDPTTLTWMGGTTGHYGDCTFTYSARLLSTAGVTGPVGGATVTFTYGATTLGTAVTQSDGKATLTLPLLLPAGSDVVTASYAATTNYQAATVSQTIVVQPSSTVGPQPGQALYTGTTWAWTTSSTSSTANLTLSATIQDIGNCPADIRTAKVTFALRNTDGTYTAIQGATNLSVGLVNPTDTSVGTANTIIQYDIGKAAGTTLNIAVIIGGNYILNSAPYDTLVTIAKPGVANSMIGGAEVNLAQFTDGTTTYPIANGYLAASAGVLDPNPNGYMQFSSYITYNKSGTNPQGSITVQFNSKQAPDGVTIYPTYHRYLIKSTAISSLAKVGAVEQFNAKGVLQDLTAGTSIDGGATLQITVTDGQLAGGSDKVGVTLYNAKTGGLWFSSSWGGQPPSTQQKPIVPGSGNVAVQ